MDPNVLQQWLDSLSPSLRVTWRFLSPEQQAAVFTEYQELVAAAYAAPRKFALLAFREHNPREHLNQPDEAILAGVGIKKLRTLCETRKI